MRTIIISLIVTVAAVASFGQDNYVEIRGATPYYDYEEYGRELPKKLTVDFVHIGVEGQHQFFAGIGRRFSPAKGVTLTPYLYAIVGSNGQRGLQVGLSTAVGKGSWKFNSYVGHFIPFKGRVKSYTTLDSGDITRLVKKRVDVGVSTGFFRQEGQWNPQAGPMVRLKDNKGSWAVSYRFGHTNELRVTRTFSF